MSTNVSPVVCDVLDDLHAVVHEVVVEDPVGDAHRHEHRDQVEALPERELLVVPVILPSPSVEIILLDECINK